jgi:hypothetical protein
MLRAALMVVGLAQAQARGIAAATGDAAVGAAGRHAAVIPMRRRLYGCSMQ